MQTRLHFKAGICVLVLFFVGLPMVFAQTGTVSGKVSASDGSGLPGANVSIVGTTIGSVTDMNGDYSFNVAAGSYELKASFVGFQAQRVTISVAAGQTSTQNFTLADDLVGAGEVIVLGSRRSGRTVTDSPVPIDVLTPEDIASSGYTETNQLLQALIPSYNAPQASITDGSDHVRPATLRGLGPDHTLVLVNGKRRHTSALVHVNGSVGRGSTGVDLNAIPASAIERIEVLRDGAAAQYGSDAIAGVINIVLKEKPGLNAMVDFGSYVTTQERGYTDGEGLISGESSTSYSWDGSVEDVNITDGQTLKVHLGYGFQVADGNLYISGQVSKRDYTNRAGLDPRNQYYSGFQNNSSFNPEYTEATFPRLNHRYGNGEFDDITLFFNGTKPVGDTGHTFYTFGGASFREGLSGCFYRRSLDNRTNRSLYPDGFLPKINAKVKDYSGAGGVKGSAGGWAFDVSETVGFNTFRFDMADTHNASMNNSPTSFDAGSMSFLQSTTNIDLFRSKDIGTASPLSVAIGGEFRWENYYLDAGEPASYLNGGIPVRDGPSAGASTAGGSQCFPGFQPESEQDETRTNVAVYVDLENNVTSQLLVSLAGRFENYSDFGSQFIAKAAAKYDVTPEVGLRGAVSTGFRAPSLAQAWFSSIATNFIDGVPFEVGTFPVASDVAQALGAQDLDPEKSVNLSAGLTYSVENLSLTADLYQIEIDDRVTFTENFTDAAVASFLKGRGINAAGGRYFTNAVDTRTKGVDITARYAFAAGPGTARLTIGANFNDTEVTNKQADGSISAPAQLQNLNQPDLVGRQRVGDFEVAQPDSKVNFQANYDWEAWRFMARANRYGKVTSLGTSANRDQEFGNAVLTDIEVGYTVKDGINIIVGANNVFDVYPDKQIKINAFNGIFPYNGFSPFGFFGRYLFTKVTFTR